MAKVENKTYWLLHTINPTYHLFKSRYANQRGCPPLGTISVGQAVCLLLWNLCWWILLFKSFGRFDTIKNWATLAHCTLGDNVFCCLVSYHHTSDLFKGPDQTCHRSSLISQMSRFYWLLFLWHFSVACLPFILACLVKTTHKSGSEIKKMERENYKLPLHFSIKVYTAKLL